MQLEGCGAAAQPGEHHVALGGAVNRITRGEHEAVVADVASDPPCGWRDDLVILHGVDEATVSHLQGDLLTRPQLVDVAKRFQIRGAVTGDRYRPPKARKSRRSDLAPSQGYSRRCP